MELKDFVRESLTQIMRGVAEAQTELSSIGGGEISPSVKSEWEKTGMVFSASGMPIQNVTFDVAVTASEKKGTHATIGVIASVLKLGAGGESQESTGNTSRIKFTVPITLPRMPAKQ